MTVTSIPHWLDGARLTVDGARTGDVFNPATGEVTGAVQLADAALVDRAVASATAAGREWRNSSLARRTQVLFAFRELVRSHADELAAAITAEHGKVLDDAAGEVARGLDNIDYAVGIAEHLRGSFSSEVGTGVDVRSIREPLGVVAGITPFNFPVMVPLWMCANAIATGNAFILKPSDRDPSASLLLAELWQQAGLPDGVFTVLQGDAGTVQELLAHRGVSAISFVGSTPVAQSVYEAGTRAGKRVQALGGAKNHMIVLPDADLGMAADAAISAAYGSAGERCMAVSVLVAVGDVADQLVKEIETRALDITVGDGTVPGTGMGPLITGAHRDRVAGYIDAGAEAGATVVLDGRRTDVPESGFFLGPSLIDNVTEEMSVYRDEIFGPVLSVVRVDTFDEAIDLVNRNEFANGVALFSRDGGAARKFEREIEVGMVGVNVPIPVPVAHYSFGGWKSSLFGSHHMYGAEGIEFFTRAKVITSRWPDPATSTIDLGFPRNR
ncbi:CoA-acylating methylmalonate-semialdehyde dehydrogenase [Nocardioides kongjuensis]|uniref:methylmalonate-semialdehyde dehydrogenase (CoA acylating) n=1 Tax=Nocardioides kongjuensis TaxID=349522 RepID=A0A852RB82_9ACTN|nr:CoA-acylating methylmalonate-semialdehyde dehydrogenase [Nocardioides kongjuensis]NYD32193.1 malonate-semialdehyde dehydrogenase (acetylating)/methylmalonate-semialdehyde dehydrogenase [Nocardioides kongjuensis]